MDHVRLLALLNTGAEHADPLQSALGVARWWASLSAGDTVMVQCDKPRFDAALAAALVRLRADVAALVDRAQTGEPRGGMRLTFRGDGSDAILFALTHAACAAAAGGTLKRIRRCNGQPCGRYFFDETKNGSKRWCSLRCMERARAPRRRTISR